MDVFHEPGDNPGGGNENRRFMVTEVTKLRKEPKGKVLRELAVGTRVRVTGEAEHKFLPVAVSEQHLHGWVDQDDISPVTKPDPSPTGGGEGVGGSPTDGGGTSTGADVGSRVADEARKYIGARYELGTHGPTTFDCSGLVYWVVLQVTGKEISPDSHAQFNLPAPISRDHLMPGDLVFYDTMNGHEVREGNTASHVGIVVGNGRMVNALNPERGVIESDPFSPYFEPRFIGARHIF